jgi:hypothetical protein
MEKMQKIKQLIQKVAKEGVAFSLSVALLYGVYDYTNTAEADYTDVSKKLRRQVSEIKANNANLEKKYRIAKRSFQLFTELKEGKQKGSFKLDRKAIIPVLDELKEKHRLSRLNVTLSPAVELANPSFRKPTASVLSSNVKLEFSALTDKDLMNFMQDISIQIPQYAGYVKLSKFDMARASTITNNLLVAISKGNKPEVAKCSLDFYWLGIKNIQKAQR